jgi:hypothetical protein
LAYRTNKNPTSCSLLTQVLLDYQNELTKI